MLSAQRAPGLGRKGSQRNSRRAVAAPLLSMSIEHNSRTAKPFDIHERLLEFACDIVTTAQFLHKRDAIARALSYQILSSGTSAGANAEEADAATSHITTSSQRIGSP